MSNTFAQASKLLRVVKNYIEHSEIYREVFPDVRPASPWTDGAITVTRPSTAKDASVTAYGIGGPVLGSRLDLCVIDDAIDFENSRTEEQRKKLIDWTLSTLLGRLVEGGKVVLIGTAYSDRDLMHVLADQGLPAFRFPAQDEVSGEILWSERWSEARLQAKRAELGIAESARQLDCITRSDEEARFKQGWLDVALQRGDGRRPLPHLLNIPQGCRVVTGCDLAVSKASSADYTAFVTILVRPEGDRELLNVEAGRWGGPDIVEKILNIHRRYQGLIVVESVAAQAYISQFVRKLGSIPVIDFKTGKNRMSTEWQSEILANELANGRWIIPSENGRVAHPEIAALLRELYQYDPRAHLGDRLAALLFARWGAEQGSRKVEMGYLPQLRRW